MAVWYEIEHTRKEIDTFLDCNWGLHDFRVEKLSYDPSQDCVDVFVKYDTGKEGRLLRFAWLRNISIKIVDDYEVDWIYDSRVFLTDHNSIVWVKNSFDLDEHCKEHFDEIKDLTTWIEAERVFWAVTDAEGNPIETPADIVDQVWDNCGKEEKHHFDLKPYIGDWKGILKPDHSRDRTSM